MSAACREFGGSRSIYYQLRDRFKRYGPDGLHPTLQRGRPGEDAQLDASVERQVLATSELVRYIERGGRRDGGANGSRRVSGEQDRG